MENQCNELFLDDIVRIRVFKSGSCEQLEVPSTVPGFTRFNIYDVYFMNPVLDISYDGKVAALENSINLKQSTRHYGSSMLYIYNVESNIISGNTDLKSLLPTLQTQDHDILITKSDGSVYLLYELPGTFSADIEDNNGTTRLTLSLSSVDDFIQIDTLSA